jgi:hypothetical protein
MWFAFLGGAVAWALHLAASWGITETTCLSGHVRIGDMPLTHAVAIATAVPLAVTVLAFVAALWMWRKTGPDQLDDSKPSAGRAHLVAAVGIWTNALFIAIIVFDGIALQVFPSCLS